MDGPGHKLSRSLRYISDAHGQHRQTLPVRQERGQRVRVQRNREIQFTIRVEDLAAVRGEE